MTRCKSASHDAKRSQFESLKCSAFAARRVSQITQPHGSIPVSANSLAASNPVAPVLTKSDNLRRSMSGDCLRDDVIREKGAKRRQLMSLSDVGIAAHLQRRPTGSAHDESQCSPYSRRQIVPDLSSRGKVRRTRQRDDGRAHGVRQSRPNFGEVDEARNMSLSVIGRHARTIAPATLTATRIFLSM